MKVMLSHRDEDLRADRQPEFTQLDMEVAFMDDVKLQSMMEGLVMRVFSEVGENKTSMHGCVHAWI